jgi:arsenical pump membrane protein
LFAGHNAVYSYGITSFLSANLMNNIPMSVLFSDVIAFSDSSSKLGAIYASIIGSNLGAFFTPIGALAGVMWMQILKKEKISLSFTSFIHYGMMLSIPALLIALTVLFLVL